MRAWLRKTSVVLALLLVMAGSLTAGTLAMYTTTIDGMAQGSVTAKEFIFLGEGTDSFAQGVKIAPAETVDWQFRVKNYDGALITETDLYYKLTVHVQAASGKQAIEPLVVSVLDGHGGVLKSVTGTGVFEVTGAFMLAQAGQSQAYTVRVFWPDGSGDAQYAGSRFGTAVHIDAVASQLPFADSEPENSGVSVLYETSPAWMNGQSGGYQYEYKVTITNNSDKTIEDWFVTFDLDGDTLTRAYSNAVMTQGGGRYQFVTPAYNNAATDDILPGQSVSFRGPAVGSGTQPIRNAAVGGSNRSAVSAGVSSRFGVALN